jgi:hypothetical protein
MLLIVKNIKYTREGEREGGNVWEGCENFYSDKFATKYPRSLATRKKEKKMTSTPQFTATPQKHNKNHIHPTIFFLVTPLLCGVSPPLSCLIFIYQ